MVRRVGSSGRKLEWRRDSGAERRTQWVSTNRLTHKLNESWRIAARINYADTDDEINPAAGAKFIEHGHRLLAMATGVVTIALVVAWMESWNCDSHV